MQAGEWMRGRSAQQLAVRLGQPVDEPAVSHEGSLPPTTAAAADRKGCRTRPNELAVMAVWRCRLSNAQLLQMPFPAFCPRSQHMSREVCWSFSPWWKHVTYTADSQSGKKLPEHGSNPEAAIANGMFAGAKDESHF